MTKDNFTKIFIVTFIIIFFKINEGKSYLSNNLTIFSESNMVYALTEIAKNYSKKENIVISVNFNSSHELIENIDLGEPADIFISSNIEWVKILNQKGVVDRNSSFNFAKDKLALVTSKNNQKINIEKIKKVANFNKILNIISKNRVPLIVASKFTSLGRYTKGILEEESNDNRRVASINNFQTFEKQDEDKKSVIDFVNQNNDYCAIVMKSSIKNNDKIEILSQIPFIEIDYRALVIAGNNMDNARKFIKYLKSTEARNILLNNGFII